LAVVLYRVNWAALWQLTSKLNFAILLLVLPLFMIPVWLRSMRWNYLLKIQDIQVSGARAFQYYAAAMFWGVITPGRIGEMIKVFYLTKRGVSTGRASLSVILDRCLDLASLFLLALLGVSLVYHQPAWFLGTLAAGGLISLGLYVMRRRLAFPPDWPRFLFFLPEHLRQALSQFLEHFKADAGKFSFTQIMMMTAVSGLIWLAYLIPFLLLAESLGLRASPVFLFTGVLAAAAISMIPVSIAGLGTREAFLIFYFGQVGIPPEQSLLFSFMFIYMHLFAGLLGLVVQPGKKVSPISLGS